MLEIKNLKKVYKTKGGVEVRALDDVSVTFPETGMVFLLGKSGSGKSTLLNVTGGLDKPDSGEIIIKGKNSKDFSSSDFDSYRNTYIGFIFQEYNILNEFNIEQNIELALQLQGKKHDMESINNILKQVDLDGLAKRKPNTLSGGQKQRVAIARALIKNPEIIMADEPTGALDSNTGKQVFDTLKKLSQEKLVIIVSHDRDFAEIYADRIIELADGKIISDVTKSHIEPKELNDNINLVNDNVLSIKNTSELTREDLDELYELLKNQNGEVIITSNEKNVKAVKQAIHISEDNKSEVFNDTTTVETKEYDPKQTKFIKSHLPFSRAFKIGASSLKSKPIRMIFTVFLTIVALVMFGVVSTLMLYNESYSVSEALKNSNTNYEQISKVYKYENVNHNIDISTGEDTITNSYASTERTYFSNSDIDRLNSKSPNKYAGVIKFGRLSQYDSSSALLRFNMSTNNNYYPIPGLTGFVDAGKDYLSENGFYIMNGKYPTNYDEIAISNYVYGMMEASSTAIKSKSDVLYDEAKGNTFDVSITVGYDSWTTKFKITGIINTGEIPSTYDDLKSENNNLNQNQLNTLKNNFTNYIGNSYHLLGYVSDNFYDHFSQYNRSNRRNRYINSVFAKGIYISASPDDLNHRTIDSNEGISYFSPLIVDKALNQLTFYDLNGNKIDYVAPKNNEVYVSAYTIGKYDSINNQSIMDKIPLILNMCYNDLYGYNLTKKANDELGPNIDYINELYYNSKGSMESTEVLNQIVEQYYDDILKIYSVLKYGTYYQEGYRLINNSDDTSFENKINNIYNEIKNGTYNYNSDVESLITTMSNSNYVNYCYLLQAASNAIGKYKSMPFNNYGRLEELVNKGSYTSSDFNEMKQILDDNYFKYQTFDINRNPDDYSTKDGSNYYYKTAYNTMGQLKVLGYFEGIDNSGYILSDEFIKANATIDNSNIYYSEIKTDYKFSDEAKYENLIAKTSYQQAEINLMLEDFGSYRYQMTNQTYIVLSQFINMIATLKTVFLITGIVFAVFAALMLFNFISSSISSKTKEIGILRAVGARGSDLFKIFFSESGVISIICIIVAAIVSYFVCRAINDSISQNLNMVLLDFGLINIGLIFAGSVIIALLGTFIPVFIASKKQPVESIRTL